MYIHLDLLVGKKIKNKIKLHLNFDILFYSLFCFSCPYFYFYFLFTATAHAQRKTLSVEKMLTFLVAFVVSVCSTHIIYTSIILHIIVTST